MREGRGGKGGGGGGSYTATKNADDLGGFECGGPKESGL